MWNPTDDLHSIFQSNAWVTLWCTKLLHPGIKFESLSLIDISLLLRLGILPLEIEAGRFTPIYDKSITKNRKRHPSERLCKICEDEIHFILICPIYEHVRQNLIKSVLKVYSYFNSLSSIEKLKLLMQHYQFESLTYTKQAWDIRQQSLHSCY